MHQRRRLRDRDDACHVHRQRPKVRRYGFERLMRLRPRGGLCGPAQHRRVDNVWHVRRGIRGRSAARRSSFGPRSATNHGAAVSRRDGLSERRARPQNRVVVVRNGQRRAVAAEREIRERQAERTARPRRRLRGRVAATPRGGDRQGPDLFGARKASRGDAAGRGPFRAQHSVAERGPLRAQSPSRRPDYASVGPRRERAARAASKTPIHASRVASRFAGASGAAQFRSVATVTWRHSGGIK